eukprot:CFRG1763T1
MVSHMVNSSRSNRYISAARSQCLVLKRSSWGSDKYTLHCSVRTIYALFTLKFGGIVKYLSTTMSGSGDHREPNTGEETREPKYEEKSREHPKIIAHSHLHDHADHPHDCAHGSHDSNKSSPSAETEEELERKHFLTVITVFRKYARFVELRIAKAEEDYKKLLPRHKALLPHYATRIEKLYTATAANQKFLCDITQPHRIFENDDALDTKVEMASQESQKISIEEHKKVRSTLKQFVRDWSAEGAKERQECYGPIVDAVVQRLGTVSDRSGVKVLVPGAGLGRLAFEFASVGFSCQGNEFSFYMLIASNFMLNRSGAPIDIFPWVHEFSNHYDVDDQYRAISIPDVEPGTVLGSSNADFSMTAGDFLDCYVTENSWDVVASCYFIDTAKNVIDYIERIYDILKPGGLFVNMGPLLYHFSDSMDLSIELSYQEVKDVMVATGFVIEEERTGINSNYIGNRKSMYNTAYDCVFFVASKPNA